MFIVKCAHSIHKKQLPLALVKKCYHNLDSIVYQSIDMKKILSKHLELIQVMEFLIHNQSQTLPLFLFQQETSDLSTVPKFIIVGSLVKKERS